MAFVELTTIYGTSDPVPYASAHVQSLQFVQSSNVLYVVHPSYPPAKVTKVADNDWRYELLAINNGPYMARNAGDELITLSLTNVVDRVTLTSNNTAAFSGLMVNEYIEYPIGSRWVIGRVTNIDSPTQVRVTALEDRCFIPSKEVYCRGSNAAAEPLPEFDPIAPVTVDTTDSPVFSHSFVVTREVVGNFLRFSREDGTVYWMSVTKTKAPTSSSASYGSSCDGDILAVTRPSQVVVRQKRVITATLRASPSGFFHADRTIGRWYRLTIDDKIIHCKVTARTSSTEVTVELSDAPPVTVDNPELAARRRGTSTWLQGSFYEGNYPATVALHEQRLVFGGSYVEPNGLWISRTGDYSDFATVDYDGQVLDTMGITYPLASGTLNEIFWLVSRGSLLAGTAGGEWFIGPSTNREALTPHNYKAEQQSAHGSLYTQAAIAARSTMFLQGDGQKLREFTYNSSDEGYIAADATIFSEHILRDHDNGVMVAYQQLPDSTVYVVCGDGQVAVLTYEPDQRVYAWSRYILGGNNARVNSVAVDQSGVENIIYLNVTRSVNGTDRTTLETLRVEFRPDTPTDRTDMIFMDGYQEIDLGDLTGAVLPAATALLADYRAETVCLLIDDDIYENIVVPATGDFTLPATPVTRAVIGYPYTSRLTTLPMDFPMETGTTQGKTKRISQIVLRLLDTAYLEHGPDNRPLNPSGPTPDAPLTVAPFFSGDIRVPYDLGHDRRAQIQVRTDKPLPLTLLAIYPEVNQTQ